MSDDSNRQLPAERHDPDLDELAPHEQTIERVAGVYFGACARVARTIRTIQEVLGSSDEKR